MRIDWSWEEGNERKSEGRVAGLAWNWTEWSPSKGLGSISTMVSGTQKPEDGLMPTTTNCPSDVYMYWSEVEVTVVDVQEGSAQVW